MSSKYFPGFRERKRTLYNRGLNLGTSSLEEPARFWFEAPTTHHSLFTTHFSLTTQGCDRFPPCDDPYEKGSKSPRHPLHLSYSYVTVPVLLREAEVCSFPMRLRSEGDDRLLA